MLKVAKIGIVSIALLLMISSAYQSYLAHQPFRTMEEWHKNQVNYASSIEVINTRLELAYVPEKKSSRRCLFIDMKNNSATTLQEISADIIYLNSANQVVLQEPDQVIFSSHWKERSLNPGNSFSDDEGELMVGNGDASEIQSVRVNVKYAWKTHSFE